MRALLVFMCFKPVHNFGEWMLNILLVNIIVAIFRILDSGKLGRERNLYQGGECQSKKGWKRVESSCLAPYPLHPHSPLYYNHTPSVKNSTDLHFKVALHKLRHFCWNDCGTGVLHDCRYMKIIYPCINEHYWTSSWKKAWKKFRPARNLNPWPLQYWCSILPTELTSQLGAGWLV